MAQVASSNPLNTHGSAKCDAFALDRHVRGGLGRGLIREGRDKVRQTPHAAGTLRPFQWRGPNAVPTPSATL